MRSKKMIVTVYGDRSGNPYDYLIELSKRNTDQDFFNAARLRHLGLAARGDVHEGCDTKRYNTLEV